MSGPFVKRTAETREIVAEDGCRLRELFHPDRDDPDLPYSLAVAFLTPGDATAPHRLSGEDELYYVIDGQGTVHVGQVTHDVGPGDVVLVPRDVVQFVRNTGETDLRWLNVVSPPWCLDHDRRVED